MNGEPKKEKGIQVNVKNLNTYKSLM
jgi:hypothetical protein